MSAATPEDRTRYVSNLCSYGPRPLLLTGLMRTLMRDHFSDASNFEHSQLARNHARVWTADEATTRILIEDATVWKPETTGLRPAIIIKQNDFDQIRMGINDQSGSTPEGFTEHAVLWKGSFTLFCLSQEGAETVILGQEVSRFLTHFGPMWRDSLMLHMWRVMQMGAVAKIKDLPGRFGVPVTVAVVYEDAWVLHQHTPRLKTLAFSDLFTSSHS